MAIQIGQWTLELATDGWQTADGRFMFKRIGNDWDVRSLGFGLLGDTDEHAIDDSGVFEPHPHGIYRMPGHSLRTIAKTCSEITGCERRLVRLARQYSVDESETVFLSKGRRGWKFIWRSRRADMSEYSWETDRRMMLDAVNNAGPYPTRLAALTAFEHAEDANYRGRYGCGEA